MSSKDRHINFKLMRDRVLNQQNGKEFWRSLEEYTDSDELQEFVSREFPQHAETWDDPVERRTFLKLMGASLALAGLSGCVYQPPESVVPYVTQPEQIVPGKPNYYATAMVMNGFAQALLARSNEGRPTKLEGNPDHPSSSGATDKFAQASLLTMYDPDRSQNVLHRGEVSSWDAFLNSSQTGKEGIKVELAEQKKKQGAGLRILTETITSPTQLSQIQEILREYPQAKWYSYDPVGNSNTHRGALMAFGANVNVVYKFSEADRILSLDADFLSDMPGNLRYIWDFSQRREPDERMNRLYTIESVMSLTGAKSDHRLALRPSEIEGFARAVAKELGVGGVQSNALDETKTKWVKAIAKDLQEHKGTSIVIAGESQPPIIHAIAHAINNTLGNVGKTVVYTDPIAASQDQNKTQLEGLKELADDMNAGKVELLAIIGGNPVYDAPADLNFLEVLKKVKFRVHLSLYNDETSEYCHWHINQAHYLEMWGDARAYDGTVTLIQPLIEPLYSGKSQHEFLGAFAADSSKKGYEILRAYWATQKLPTSKEQTALLAAGKKEGETGRQGEGETRPEATATPSPNASPTPASTPRPVASPSASPAASPASTTTAAAATPTGTLDEASWRRVVHDGFIAGTVLPSKAVALKTDWTSQPQGQAATGIEIVFRPDPNIYDGSFANNGWLQELPKPLTAMTWDNAVLMNPKTAKDVGVIKEDGWRGGNNYVGTVTIESQGHKLEGTAPIWVLPGMPDNVVVVPLGYGRTRAGRVGSGIGFNAYKIRSMSAPWFASGKVENANGSYEIASTQLHFYMENRDLVRENPLEVYLKNPAGKGDGSKVFKEDSMYEDQYNYNKEYRWGMTIDLNKCTGCNACIIACQSENNIPVVGKEQVSRSREMHWLRVDTYFGNEPDDPTGPWFMPVPCQQCEQAPCEPVCPVHATSHSPDGLNDMTYNRCVGTRYCSNNCPYKVRRFNFLLYQDWNTPQYHLMRNPEVSVRSRGVMEKCTYCVQRIQNAKIEAEKDDRKVRDGEVVTACQAVCPADAIAFGDMNDKASRIAKMKNEKRNYTILADLNTQPRTSYLSSVKNPNPELDKALGKEKKTESHGGAEGH